MRFWSCEQLPPVKVVKSSKRCLVDDIGIGALYLHVVKAGLILDR